MDVASKGCTTFPTCVNLVFDGDEQISNTLYLNEVGESFSASLIALSQDAGVRMVVEDLICWMAFGSCNVPRTN